MTMSNIVKVIWYKVPDHLIGGPFAVAALREDGTAAARVSGCRSEAAAEKRATDYAWAYGLRGRAVPIERADFGAQ